jgi:hypothetical protein
MRAYMLFLLICQKSEATETLRQNLKNLAGAVNLGVFRKFAHSVCLFICLSCHSFSNNTTPSLPVFPCVLMKILMGPSPIVTSYDYVIAIVFFGLPDESPWLRFVPF